LIDWFPDPQHFVVVDPQITRIDKQKINLIKGIKVLKDKFGRRPGFFSPILTPA